MSTTGQDIRTFIPASRIVKQAVLDMYGDYEKDQARFLAWTIRAIKKLVRETLKSPKRYAILTVNRNLNSAVLPCDFKEEIGVFLINSCYEKVPLVLNPNIVPTALAEEIGCEAECEAKCKCYPKQLCNDLQTTQVINKITINDIQYDETVTSTLLPNGEYYNVTTTPVFNTVTSAIDYINKKEYVTTFDLAECGCVKPTAQNAARVEAVCFDAWCCYCAPCSNSNSGIGGYRIFEENGTIVFDGVGDFTKVYLEYRGFLPKSGNEFLIPEVAEDTTRELTKYYSIQNKKGVPQWERRDQFDSYTRERGNMTKVLGRGISISDIVHSAFNVPKFEYNYNACGNGCGGYAPSYDSGASSSSNVAAAISNMTVVNTINCKPSILTTNGGLMEGGVKYVNSIMSEALSFRIFAGAFNRYMKPTEYNILPEGGFEVLTGVYGPDDDFDVILRWC